jgi:hypothetical protein
VPTRMLDNEKRALVFTPGRKFDLHSGARKCPGSRVYRIAFRALDLLASESSSVLVKPFVLCERFVYRTL